MEVIGVPSEWKDTLRAITHQTVSEERSPEEEHYMGAQKTVSVGQVTLRDSVNGIPGFLEDSITAPSTAERHNGNAESDNGLKAKLHSLLNKVVDEKLWTGELDDRLICVTDDETTSALYVTKRREAMV